MSRPSLAIRRPSEIPQRHWPRGSAVINLTFQEMLKADSLFAFTNEVPTTPDSLTGSNCTQSIRRAVARLSRYEPFPIILRYS